MNYFLTGYWEFNNGELSNPYGSSRSFDQEVKLGYDDCGADVSHRKGRTWLHSMYTFWESNMAMENRFMDEFPMKTSIDRGFPVAMFGW